MVKMYCASTTPPTSAHTLALATAPILATAVLSMVVDPGAPGAAAGKRGCALGVGEGARSLPVLPDRTPGRQRRRRTRPAGPAPRRPYHATGERGRERVDARVKLSALRPRDFYKGFEEETAQVVECLGLRGFFFSSQKIQNKYFLFFALPPKYRTKSESPTAHGAAAQTTFPKLSPGRGVGR